MLYTVVIGIWELRKHGETRKNTKVMRLTRQSGYTLLEILVTMGLIGVLAVVAYPSYEDYLRKSRYSEMVTAAIPYKNAVGVCFNRTGSLANCSASQNGIPPNISNSQASLLRFLFTLPNGRIFAFPSAQSGFTLLGDYYVLTPTVTNGVLTWQFSGPAVTKGYINN